MQTLAAHLTATFVDDAIALVKGCAKAVARIVTAPIERIANACDVAGVLAQRRSVQHRLRAMSKIFRSHSPSKFSLSPFRALSQLT